MTPRLKKILPFLLILALSLCAYSQLLSKGKIPYSPHSDLLTQHLATKTKLHNSIENGHGIPQWREDQFSGNAASMNLQAMYYYPFHFLFLLTKPTTAVGPTIFINFLIASFGFLFLARVLRLSLPAQIFMSIAGLFNFKFIAVTYSGWLSNTMAIALLPWFFAALIYFVRRPGLGSSLLLSLSSALVYTGGHIQYFYYAIFFGFLYLIIILLSNRKQGKQIKKLLIWLSVSVFLMIGFCAYKILPLIADAKLLSRSIVNYDFFLAGHALSFKHLLTFIYPEILGTPIFGGNTEFWEIVGYFGMPSLIFALVALTRIAKNRTIFILTVAFFFSILLAFDTPLLRFLFQYFPGYRIFRSPARMLFLTSLFGIALSGFGFQTAVSFLNRKSSWKKFVPAFIAIIFIITAVEGIWYAKRYIRCVPESSVWPQVDSTKFLQIPKGTFRVAPIGRAAINYGWAAPLGLELIAGYDPYNYSHYWKYFDLMTMGRFFPDLVRVWGDVQNIIRLDLLNALNVEYLISDKPLSGLPGNIILERKIPKRPIFVFYKGMHQADLYLYRNTTAQSRAYWGKNLVAAKSENDEKRFARQLSFDRSTIVLADHLEHSVGKGHLSDRIKINSVSDGNLELILKNQEQQFLVLSEIWHPGWQARLDGKSITLYRTNLALSGAWIPPGEHRLEVEFHAPFAKTGIIITCLSLFAGVFAALFLLRKKVPVQE